MGVNAFLTNQGFTLLIPQNPNPQSKQQLLIPSFAISLDPLRAEVVFVLSRLFRVVTSVLPESARLRCSWQFASDPTNTSGEDGTRARRVEGVTHESHVSPMRHPHRPAGKCLARRNI